MNQHPEQKDITTSASHTDLHQEVKNMRQDVIVSAGDLPATLVQKVAQISKALHLVTKHVDKNDPICESLRRSSVDLVINFYDLLAVEYQTSLQQQKCEFLLHNLYKTGSLIQLAQVSQCISLQNSLIIEREVLKLIQLVDSFKNTLSEPRETYKQIEHSVITQIFSSTESYTQEPQKEVATAVLESSPLAQLKPKPVISVVQNQNKEKTVVTPKASSSESVRSFVPSQLVERDNDGIRRQALITKLVRDKQEVTIKDITSILPHVSEKTLQRDLTSLSEKGLVRKEGERRWAKYLAV
jgi:hypothetical protein